MPSRPVLALMSGLTLCIAGGAALGGEQKASETSTETIVIMRHGEKPEEGLGQLNCQGKNRARALPPVFNKMFGKPAALFAPDPNQQKKDKGVVYDYLRPRDTIEPLAASLGIAVNTEIGRKDIAQLAKVLTQERYRNAVVAVAWEHSRIPKIARLLLSENGGDPALAPKWDKTDFDSFYVVTIKRSSDKTEATFSHQRQGLNGQSTDCQ